jgi:hypothetical protein
MRPNSPKAVAKPSFMPLALAKAPAILLPIPEFPPPKSGAFPVARGPSAPPPLSIRAIEDDRPTPLIPPPPAPPAPHLASVERVATLEEWDAFREHSMATRRRGVVVAMFMVLILLAFAIATVLSY